jgi:hypothetical protein
MHEKEFITWQNFCYKYQQLCTLHLRFNFGIYAHTQSMWFHISKTSENVWWKVLHKINTSIKVTAVKNDDNGKVTVLCLWTDNKEAT